MGLAAVVDHLEAAEAAAVEADSRAEAEAGVDSVVEATRTSRRQKSLVRRDSCSIVYALTAEEPTSSYQFFDLFEYNILLDDMAGNTAAMMAHDALYRYHPNNEQKWGLSSTPAKAKWCARRQILQRCVTACSARSQ